MKEATPSIVKFARTVKRDSTLRRQRCFRRAKDARSRFHFLAVLCTLGAILVAGCATTQYGRVEVAKLTDSQLIEEFVSIERELGVQVDYRTALLAIDTSPRPVVTSANTIYSGSFNGQYNDANRTLYGSFNGSGFTTYQYTDANGGARFGQVLGLAIVASNVHKLENRRVDVVAEISRRRDARQNIERVTGQFLLAHQDIAANQDLFIACLLAAPQQTGGTLERLQRTADVMLALPKNRWIGWVEAHGHPEYPYGVVVTSYFMDTIWDGDTLAGKGQTSNGSALTLTGKKKQDGTIEGIVQSRTMEAHFVGRMTDLALCVDYQGTENGHPIRGITWAFRRAKEL